MNSDFRFSLPLSLLAAGFLAGCQSEPTAPQSGATSANAGVDARQQAYARELHALKATIADQKTLEAKHLELLSKYGYPLPDKEPEPEPAIPASSMPGLAKTASGHKYALVKQTSGTIYRTYQDEIVVPAGAQITIGVVGKDGADPFLVAYYRLTTGGIRYLIANDDSAETPNLDSYAKWINASEFDLRVVYTVFASLTTARGWGDLFVAIDGGGVHAKTTVTDIRIGGTVQYQNDFPSLAPTGCQDPATSSRFYFGVNTGSNTAQLLAYSAQSSTGAEGSADVNGITVYSDFIPSGTPKSGPSERSFVLASRASTVQGYTTITGGYTYFQHDRFPCN